MPFTEKLFVHADGKFGICETACDKVILGDLENGFDYNALADIYSKAHAFSTPVVEDAGQRIYVQSASKTF